MSKNYNFLVESSDQVDILTEDTAHGKSLYINGIFAQSEIRNGNGRLYKHGIMESAVRKFNEQYVNKRRALGEINHPERPFADPSEAAIRITEMYMQGNDVIGKALVLDTPKGQTLRGLLEGGFALGVSTRGLGSLKEQNGIKYVQDDFMMTAVDAVDNPSAPGALVNPLYESQQWTLNESGMWIPVMDKGESDYINEQLFLEKLEQYIKGFKK